jgi:hypothetical protein
VQLVQVVVVVLAVLVLRAALVRRAVLDLFAWRAALVLLVVRFVLDLFVVCSELGLFAVSVPLAASVLRARVVPGLLAVGVRRRCRVTLGVGNSSSVPPVPPVSDITGRGSVPAQELPTLPVPRGQVRLRARGFRRAAGALGAEEVGRG